VARPEGCWCGGRGFRWPVEGETYGPNERHFQGRRESDKFVFCICPKGQAQLGYLQQDEERAFASSIEGVRIAIWQNAGIPPRLRDARLDYERAPKIASRLYRRENAAPQSFLFWGDYGRGKTGLAVSYARQWVETTGDEWPRSVVFRSLPDVSSELKATYSRNDTTEIGVIDFYRHAGILVLDDMGAEQLKETRNEATSWVEEKLYQIIGGRHGLQLPIVCTSNLNPDQLARRIGERTMWRLMEMCGPANVIEVKGPNLREPQ
jgi:DNA replication protein DnaC